ncbi:hypothetical protein ACFQ0Q_00355 [Streptomyces aureus]
MMLATKPDATALRQHSGYTNWRPAITGVTVLALVGVDNLVLPRLMGGLVLPTGTVEDGQSPEDAAQLVLSGMPGGLPIQRRVAVDEEHTRRRKVISHLVVTAPLTVEEAQCLVYRDPRADTDVPHFGGGLAADGTREGTRPPRPQALAIPRRHPPRIRTCSVTCADEVLGKRRVRD